MLRSETTKRDNATPEACWNVDGTPWFNTKRWQATKLYIRVINIQHRLCCWLNQTRICADVQCITGLISKKPRKNMPSWLLKKHVAT